MIDYYPEGCPLCGSSVEYNEENYFYKCTACEAWSSAHRTNTEYSKEHEPKGILCDQATHNIKKQLEPLFNYFWQGRYLFQHEGGTRFTAPINVVYRPFLRRINLLDEPKYGIAHGIEDDGFVKVWVLEDERFSKYKHEELIPVDNRQKAHIWLASMLNIPISECRLGYLDKSQLLMAIKICTEHGELAREQVAYNS